MAERRSWLYAVLALAGGLIGGAIATQFVSGVAMAERHPRKVQAEQFVMVDRDGTQRATLQVNARGTAALAIYDPQGRDRAELSVDNNGGASIGLFGQNGSHRVLIGDAPSGRVGIAIFGTKGKQLINLSTTPDNQTSLTLYDPPPGGPAPGWGSRSTGRRRS